MVYPKGAERVRVLNSQAFADTLNAAKNGQGAEDGQDLAMDGGSSTIHDSTDGGAYR